MCAAGGEAPPRARPSPSPVAESFDQWWRSSIEGLEKAIAAENVAGVEQAKAELERKLGPRLPPAQALPIRQALAYADWRLTFLPAVSAEQRVPLLADAT